MVCSNYFVLLALRAARKFFSSSLLSWPSLLVSITSKNGANLWPLTSSRDSMPSLLVSSLYMWWPRAWGAWAAWVTGADVPGAVVTGAAGMGPAGVWANAPVTTAPKVMAVNMVALKMEFMVGTLLKSLGTCLYM